MIDISEVIKSLVPTAAWSLDGSEIIWQESTINPGELLATNLTWYSTDVPIPSKEQIDAKQIELQVIHDSLEYQRQRKKEYPPIGDQLDALWKGGEAAAEMLAQVHAVKNKYPKE
jgi:hypothetical protein